MKLVFSTQGDFVLKIEPPLGWSFGETHTGHEKHKGKNINSF